MPMTRQRARSSFIFEIKRTDRRTTEVVTLEKTPSTSSSSLVDQVFGKYSVKTDRQQTSGGEHSSVPTAVVCAVPVGTAPETPRVRRVLPDLLSTLVDAVEQRMAREAEERAARRKAPKPFLIQNIDKQPPLIQPKPNPVVAAEPPLPEVSTSPEPRPSVTQTRNRTKLVEIVTHSGARKPKRLKTAAMRAERRGRPLPHLPAGQRWKRRLPRACW
jgi:hypothetical protein